MCDGIWQRKVPCKLGLPDLVNTTHNLLVLSMTHIFHRIYYANKLFAVCLKL